MGWGSNIKRQMKIFTLALTIYLDYKTAQKKEKWTKENGRDKMWDHVHERNAKRLLKAILEMEGLWVKLGQYLSTRADVLPDAYIRCLKQLQDSLPPRPSAEVHHTIELELGKPLKELFLDFDEVPLATASIAQVHRAHTKNGIDVVVKVQHVGIKKVILQDLKNAKTVVEWIAWAEPQYNFGPVLNEWCAEVPKELDFNAEGENTRRVAKNLTSRNENVGASPLSQVDVLVPDVIQSTEKVLVLQYMDGIKLSDVAALNDLGVDKQALVEGITRSYAHQIYVDGFFNGDPHPGNFLVSKEPPFRPILLDFGLTKTLSFTMKQAFAKMLLACAEGDYAALLSSFTEMGLKFRLDMPEDVMAVANFFFRRAIPGKESVEDMKTWTKEREERMKRIQEKMKQEETGKSLNRNPVDAFPGDAVFFMRVLNLLRGLSSMLGAHVIYLDVMRPFAEATLWSENIPRAPQLEGNNWISNTPTHSEVEEKLRVLLISLGRQHQILGIQICAYMNGQVIIDTAAGVLGKYDPRPVQPDCLFPVFSVTKGVTAAIVHWLVDQGKLSLSDKVASFWPEFAVNGKENCTVSHILNHTAGLHNALSDLLKEDPLLMCNWDEMLKQIALAPAYSSPGSNQVYHALTYGWLCGGLIERASGRKFKELLEDVFVHPLGVEGEFYIGVPPGVEARLASLTLDTEELQRFNSLAQTKTLLEDNNAADKQDAKTSNVPSLSGGDRVSLVSSMPALFNMLFIRRAIIPAANGHFSARALARFYAMLAAGGSIPPMCSSSEPPLGSHPHTPKFSIDTKGKKKRGREKDKPIDNNVKMLSTQQNGALSSQEKLYKNLKIHDMFLGSGEFTHLAHSGPFGLGFRRYSSIDDTNVSHFIGFGHSGVGGSTAFCYPAENFSLAITLNKLSLGGVTGKIVGFICSELGIQCPIEYLDSSVRAPDINLDIRTPV